jgi:hypothetical protein
MAIRKDVNDSVRSVPTGADRYQPKPLDDKNDFVEEIDSQDALHCIKMIDADLSNFEITAKETNGIQSISSKTLTNRSLWGNVDSRSTAGF